MAAALSFLTRVPIPARTPFSAADTGRSSYWFPLIGAMLGLIYALAVRVLSPVLPCIVVAVIVIVIEALLTGALHLDGVADMADGFGGGRDRADVLRIMRDHAIGAYGATALILIILLKVTTISALCEHHLAEQYLIAGPALSRWATVLLSWLSPYARRAESDGVNAGGAVSDFIGRREFLLATLICAVVVGVVLRWRGLVSWAVVILSTAVLGRWSYKRIAGVTGDTLGANIEICETAVLLAGLVLSAT